VCGSRKEGEVSSPTQSQPYHRRTPCDSQCFTQSAKGAIYDSQGQARSAAERSASPLVAKATKVSRPERPRYTRSYDALSGLLRNLGCLSRGDVPTSRDLPLALISRAFGARFQ